MLRNPKITFMTTLGINVGDEFIRDGIFSFFDEILDSYSPFYVNKHDLETLKRTCEDENLTLHDKFLDADIIVQAGAPVYWNLGESTCYNVSWAKELWEDRIFRLGEKKMIFNIAAGSCQPYPGSAGDVADDPKCAAFARQVDQACCWNSVRDPLASEILTRLGLKHEALPCTAFHAARRYPLPHNTYGNVLAVNLMPLGGHFRLKEEISEELWGKVIQEMLPHLRKYHHLLFVAHTLDEKKFMERWRSGSEVIFYSPRWRDYLPVYAHCICTLANRVHGAVCAAGFGRPSVIVGNDTRLQIGQFIDIPSRYVASVTAREIVDLVETGLKNSVSERERLLELRERSAQRYCTAISEKICEFSEKRNHHLPNISTMVKTNPKKPQRDGSVQTSKPFSLETCKNILIPRFDTFGDIVLLEGFVRGLLHLLPKARVTFLVRQGYDQLSTIFPQRLIWKATRIDPYQGETDSVQLSMFLRELKGEPYDLVLFTAYNRTWLDDLTASILTSSWRVGLGDSVDIPDYLPRIPPDLDTEIASCPFDEFISVDERSHETEKYQILWERLTGGKSPLPPSELSISKEMDRIAEEVLAKLGLADETYYICSPAGIANVPMKFWPEENHAQIIAHLERSYRLRALVVGYETEEKMIEKVINGAKQKGAHPESWLGKDGDIPLACALAKRSSFYFGSDTGLMHMSAALDKPILAIFGGGTWPRFLPRAKIGRAFFSPMPCFYCKWDCLFDKALCLQSLSSDMVLEQLREAIEEIRQGEGEFKVVEERADYDRLFLFFDKAVGCLRASAGDRATRLNQIEEMGELLKESEADREARLEQIEKLGKLLQESEDDRAARLEQIEKLGKLLQESEDDRAARLKQIEELTAWLKESESDRAARLKVIEALGIQLAAAKEGWRNLEQSFTVRQARRIGLIRAKRFDLPESSNSNEE